MSTQKELREFKELITSKSKEFEKSTQGVKEALETIELNNQWKINNYLLFASRLNHIRMTNFDSEDDNVAMDEAESVTENSMSE